MRTVVLLTRLFFSILIVAGVDVFTFAKNGFL